MVTRSDGKIIGGTNPADLPSPMGWRARQTRAMEKKEQRQAGQGGIRLRQHIMDCDRARAAVSQAVDRRDALVARIDANKGKLAVHRKTMLQTGIVPTEMQSLSYGIEQAGALIMQAEADIARAQSALEGAQQRRDDAMAAHAAAENGDHDAADPAIEPVADAGRGRGRPRKVQP